MAAAVAAAEAESARTMDTTTADTGKATTTTAATASRGELVAASSPADETTWALHRQLQALAGACSLLGCRDSSTQDLAELLRLGEANGVL